MPNSLICLADLALAMMLLVSHAESQQRKPDDGGTPTIRVEVNVVNILATVRDKHGALINNLTKDDFILTDDGQPQQIKYFARETDVPLTIGLLVDVSASQRHLIDIERDAAYQFLSQVLRQDDHAFLVSFGGDVKLLQDFTRSPRLLQTALARLSVRHGRLPTIGPGTVLYDAVYLAAKDQFMHQGGRKAMVLITDGIDQGSRLKLEEAVKGAQRADSAIYSIAYVDMSAYCDDPCVGCGFDAPA